MQPKPPTDPHRVWLTGAVVFRADAGTVESLFSELRSRPELRVVYVRSDGGRLKIVPEEVRP
jgi:hypothetical protein